MSLSLQYANYTLPSETNVTGLYGTVQYLNAQTNYVLAFTILIVLWVVFTVSLLYKTGSVRKSFGAGMYFMIVLAMIFRGIDLISDLVALVIIGVGVLLGIWLSKGED